MNAQYGGIIGWFARNPVSANLLLISVIVMGVLSSGSIRKEAFPSMNPDTIRVSMTYDSGVPKLAEEGIAVKIEDALEGVPGIKRVTSTSNAGGSEVLIEKKTDYDLDTLLTDVKTKIDAIYNFPVDSEKPTITKGRRQDHAIWVQLYGDLDRLSMQALAERLKVDLLNKPGISDVSMVGKAEPMISVEIDEGKLQAFGLSLGDVADAINRESSTALTTSLRNGEKVIRLKSAQQAYHSAEFARIPLLSSRNGAQVNLGDVANIQDTFEDNPLVLSRYNGKNGIAIELLMDQYGDVTDIVEQANQVVANWHAKGKLPANVELVSWYDKSTMITERLSLLTSNALTGIALVFVVLALFLNLRVALWVAAGLPFIFFGTLYFMTDSYTAMTINEMTTFGFIMALGIVVDDAVVVGESVYSTRQAEGDSLNSTIKGTLKVAVPTIFGVLTTVAAFGALSQVSGGLGRLYSQFGTIVTICLLLSVVESKLILPAHLAHVNTRKKTNDRNWWERIQHVADSGLVWFNNKLYKPAIGLALRFRYAVVLFFIAIFILVIGMPLTGSVRVAFFPSIPGDVVRASMSMQTDAGFGQTASNLNWLEKTALQADRQLSANGESGLGSLQVVASADDSGSIAIELNKTANYTVKDFADVWKSLAGSPEGVKKLKIRSRREMVDNFKVEIKASDESSVLAAGQQFKQALQGIAGVSGIDDNLSPGQPLLRFELTEQGRALGMDTAQLSKQILRLFGGEVVQRFQRDKDEIKVRVRYPENARKTLADVMVANIRLDDSSVVPLTTVATISSDYQQDEITRIDNLRAVYISAAVDAEQISSNELVATVQSTIVPSLEAQYPGLSIHFAGEAEQQAETTSSMSGMFMLALISIYVLLAVPLKSYIQPVLIMTAIPFGIVGAILGHWWNDLTLSILSMNGILALSGVVVNDSLLLVSRFNELREEGLSLHDAITESCTSRLRAVLLTSFTTYGGLMPILGETSKQAQFLIPAAASLGYGILFATLITLILIPALLLIQSEIKQALVELPAKLLGKTGTEVQAC